MSEDPTIMLSAKGLSGGYGRVPILHGIDLEVAENEVVGVLGHNGMGKTTLLKTLMGFLPATSGQVRFDQTDITRSAPNERGQMGIGYVPQGRGIFPQLSVRDNLRFAWHDYGAGSEAEVMENVLKDFPRLTRLLDRDGGALSGGEQQLLALARCLMGNPDFLLLDEPTEGIQPSIIEEMAETLLHLRETRGLSILLVERGWTSFWALARGARGRAAARPRRPRPRLRRAPNRPSQIPNHRNDPGRRPLRPRNLPR